MDSDLDTAVQGEGKIYPVCKNQGPLTEEKKRDPTPEKTRRPPTKFLPNFYLHSEQNLREKHILKFFLPVALNKSFTLIWVTCNLTSTPIYPF